MSILRLICHQIKHKFWVAVYCLKFCIELMWRALIHDMSKFSKIEFKSYCKSIGELKSITFGSEEYYASLKRLGPALDHHYKVNRHHPQYFKDSYRGMNLLDFVEMFFDWKAAIKKHSDGNLKKSIDFNGKRFKMSTVVINLLDKSVDSGI